MSQLLTMVESMKVIDSALRKGQSLVELITIQTGITLQHLAIVGDEILKRLRATTYELMTVKSLTGNTKQPIERSLSKSLVLFLHELRKQGENCHYATIRDAVHAKYELMVNDYSTLKYYRLIEKSKTGNGYWKITERGIQFLNGVLKLSEKVTVQNDKVISASNKLVTVNDFIELKEFSVEEHLIEKRKDGLSRYK